MVDLLEQEFNKYAPKNEFDLVVYTIIITAVISQLIYQITKIISPHISKHYQALTDGNKADWDSR